MLFLATIMGTILIAMPSLWATEDTYNTHSNIFLPDEIYLPDRHHEINFNRVKETMITPEFHIEHSGPRSYLNGLHALEGIRVKCEVNISYLEKSYLEKPKWISLGEKLFRKYPIYLHIYDSHDNAIWGKKLIANGKSVYLPNLNRGNYTLDFSYAGSRKQQLTPCHYKLAYYVH